MGFNEAVLLLGPFRSPWDEDASLDRKNNCIGTIDPRVNLSWFQKKPHSL